MKTIKLTKMQGCGNDFVIIDFKEYEKTGLKMDELAKKVCDRNFGVGADGMIIPKTDVQGADIGWYFYNSDGSFLSPTCFLDHIPHIVLSLLLSWLCICRRD